MSQSLSKLYVHIIFHVKNEQVFIRSEDEKVEIVKKYIERQKEHHKRLSFKEEYIKFLREYGVEYNENYLWE